jgi:ABC-type nitrate/sulfonate/bicarbonate transport system substrate-binding protein
MVNFLKPAVESSWCSTISSNVSGLPVRLRLALGLVFAAVLVTTNVAAADKKMGLSVLRLGSFSSTVVSAAWSQTVAHDRILREELARQGFTLAVKYYPNSPSIATAFAAREVDVGPQTELTLFKAIESHATVVGLLGFSYVAVVARSAAAPQDLVGATVAVRPKTVGELALTRMLDAAGIEKRRITQVERPIADMQSALESGEVDAIAMWEPMPQRILRAHPEYRALFRNASPTALVMRDDLLLSHPLAARAVAAAYLRAYRWWGMHDRNMLKAVEWALGDEVNPGAELTQAALLDGVQTLRSSVTGVLGLPLLPLGWTTDEGEARQKFDFLQKYQWLPPEKQWNDSRKGFDRDLLQSILKDAGRYRLEEFRYE